MKLCRFQIPTRMAPKDIPSVGLIVSDEKGEIIDLSAAGWADLSALLDRGDLPALLATFDRENLRRHRLDEVRLCAPIGRQEVWAAGVTYVRSKTARMAESQFGANAYDRVYAADRPELFFKSMPEKVVGPGDPVGIRRDARWSVPEPELALVLDSSGRLAGYTIGNDMSSRDIEGENLLYLPQAKVYHRSCALGPWIVVGPSEVQAREWSIRLEIQRGGQTAFADETSVGQIKRPFADLAEFLFRSQRFPAGTILLTGTGLVPPDTFSLRAGDVVRIDISGIGALRNPVVEV
jgi:2-dehydro-3-deoxy-D-arabinonate dehydratase